MLIESDQRGKQYKKDGISQHIFNGFELYRKLIWYKNLYKDN